MKSASISEIKKELLKRYPVDLLELCLQMAKFKKENKELLNYLLFDAQNQESFLKSVKEEIEEQFDEMNRNNMHFAKKSLRKILKTTNKYIKFSGSKQVEVELLIFYCKTLKKYGLLKHHNTTIENIYDRQLLKINKILPTLHEDLQFDYKEVMDEI